MKIRLLFLCSFFATTISAQFFTVEETIDGKYYSKSLVRGEIDTIIIKNQIEKPMFSTQTVNHPRTQKLIKTEIDTIIYDNKNGKCLSDTTTTYSFYNIKPDQKTRNELIHKDVVKIPAYTEIQIVEGLDNYEYQISTLPPTYEKVWEAVRTGLECRVVTESEMMEQTRGRLSNCHQNQHIRIKNYYEIVEAWNEEVIVIDENAQQYFESTHYHYKNELRRVEVHPTEKKLVKNIQSKLKKAGYYKGKISGELDKITQTAILKYQKDNNLPQGQLDVKTVKHLKLSKN